MDVSDALELLGPTFQQVEVRRYAVARLQQADDEELLLYLLQLVQALKYEDFEEICAAYEREKILSSPPPVHREALLASADMTPPDTPTERQSPTDEPPEEEEPIPEVNTESLLDALGDDPGHEG